MSVSLTSFNFTDAGGSNTFNVSSNVGWTVQSSADWCTVSPTTGDQNGSVTIQVAANMEATSRNCTITVKSLSGNLTKEIAVTQETHAFTLNVTTTELNFEAAASVQLIVIEGDDTFEATSSEPDWCSIQAAEDGSQGVSVNVLENETGAVRTATITITGKNTGKSFDVSVTQKTKKMSVSLTSFIFTDTGGSNTFNVTSDVSWTVQSSADWCTVSPTTGDQNGSVTIQVAAHMEATPRNCTITVKSLSGNLTKEIAITQEAHVFTLNVTTTELNLETTASVQFIAIEGDDPFKATSSEPDWCSIQVAEDGSQGITVNVLENETVAVRTATITIKGKNTGKSFKIRVTQKAKSVIDRADYDPDAPLGGSQPK
jgi:nicotinamide mononucleotide (NMN) deamidase PncC